MKEQERGAKNKYFLKNQCHFPSHVRASNELLRSIILSLPSDPGPRRVLTRKRWWRGGGREWCAWWLVPWCLCLCPLAPTVPLIISPRRPTLNSDHGDHWPLELGVTLALVPTRGTAHPAHLLWLAPPTPDDIPFLCIPSFPSFLDDFR